MLVEVAAFLGEQLIKELGEKWNQWEKDMRGASILDLKTYIRHNYPMLNISIESWKNQEVDFFKEDYLHLLARKLPVSKEKIDELIGQRTQISALKKKSR